jgi:hypothetical protein
MTPNDIDILIHYNKGTTEPHPRAGAPAVNESIERFISVGCLEMDKETFKTSITNKGKALVRMLCKCAPPQAAWIDKDGNIV